MNTKHSGPVLGCIADDFTGASDLASFLVASGMRTVQINGLPNAHELSQYHAFDAIVIALKTRTAPRAFAISESLSALKVLTDLGCKKYYFKYCSTFDSSATGNIGPVIDALLHALESKSAIVCPALPINGRTVYQGHLFVFDKPLHESALKDHPLTPMHDSSLIRLLEAQASGKAINIPYSIVEQGRAVLKKALNSAAENSPYLIIDALNEQHLKTLGESVASFKLLTGGSGIALNLVSEFEQQGFIRRNIDYSVKPLAAPCMVISGSCSENTQAQVADFQKTHPALFIDPFKLHSGEQSIETILAWLKKHQTEVPLIYASANEHFVQRVHSELGQDTSQALIENTLAQLATECVNLGFRNFIIAGGETSGAIVKALNIIAFQIGRSIAPGVPMLQTLESHPLNLALKSGNFGDIHFFQQAIEALTCS